MTDFSNKYFKIKDVDFYFKTSNCSHDNFGGSINFEIIDYSGAISNLSDMIWIHNKIYLKISYSFVTKFEEITSEKFYENLADRIVRFIIKCNFNKPLDDFMELDFNATDERRALYRKIKVPLIIKETIL